MQLFISRILPNRIIVIRLSSMNDTKKAIWQYFAINYDKELQSSDIANTTGGSVSLVTIKRYISELESERVLAVLGAGRSTRYRITQWGKIHAPLGAVEYFKKSEFERNGQKSFDFDIFPSLSSLSIFTESELQSVRLHTTEYRNRVVNLSEVLHKKELERFVIELSWKSSKIEGNTYTLLDTEKLIREGIPAEGHKPEEAIMILNHKKAFEYVLQICFENSKIITHEQIMQLHLLLVSDLGVATGLRSGPVGITGSSYVPVDIPSVINEQFSLLVDAMNQKSDPYSRALIALVGISYLQPFEDGNKRTARLLANAYLLLEKCAPLSYRNVDEELYRNSLLVFYEHNSIEAFKKIFMEQYQFSCEYYNVQ